MAGSDSGAQLSIGDNHGHGRHRLDTCVRVRTRQLDAEGDCLYPLTGVSVVAHADLADVVVGHERTAHGTSLHSTVRMPVTEVLGRSRPEVIRKALAMVAGHR